MSEFWKDHDNDTLKKWQDTIEKNSTSTFCALPWIHIATRPNGDMRLCCGSNASQATKGILDAGIIKQENGTPANFAKESLFHAFNNDYMKDVRQTMMEGKIPASCSKCFEEESKGITSKRVWESYYWQEKEGIDFKELIEQTDHTGEVPLQIQYLDLRLGHTCNLKCVMCSPHDSSRWVQDYDKLIASTKNEIILKEMNWDKAKFNNYWYENPELWEEIFDQIPHIKQLYFAGGEPLMIKEHRKFLKEIVKRGYAKDIVVRYNSNGLLLDQDMLDIWSNFREVRFAFSIDAVGERNNYIRYPTNWDTVVKNLHWLDSTPDNIKIGIACAVQVFNIKHIIDFAKWIISQDFKKINKFMIDTHIAGGGIMNMHMLYIPTYLSARVLTIEEKQELVNDFDQFKKWLWNNYTQDDDFWKHNPNGWKRWESILKFVMGEDHSHLRPTFYEYTKKLDKIRKMNYEEIFPELQEKS